MLNRHDTGRQRECCPHLQQALDHWVPTVLEDHFSLLGDLRPTVPRELCDLRRGLRDALGMLIDWGLEGETSAMLISGRSHYRRERVTSPQQSAEHHTPVIVFGAPELLEGPALPPPRPAASSWETSALAHPVCSFGDTYGTREHTGVGLGWRRYVGWRRGRD